MNLQSKTSILQIFEFDFPFKTIDINHDNLRYFLQENELKETFRVFSKDDEGRIIAVFQLELFINFNKPKVGNFDWDSAPSMQTSDWPTPGTMTNEWFESDGTD